MIPRRTPSAIGYASPYQTCRRITQGGRDARAWMPGAKPGLPHRAASASTPSSSLFLGKPMAGLFTGNLERHNRITAPPALGQPAEHVLQQVAEAFHRILPTGCAVRRAMRFWRWHSETFFHRVSIVLYRCAFSQLNFTPRRFSVGLFRPFFASFFTPGWQGRTASVKQSGFRVKLCA
jgi:hypothetical protein